MQSDKEQHIISSWHENACAWAKAVQKDEIASRKLVTNQAILTAIMKYKPAAVLDVGCGEGWLSRALSSEGAQVTGIDAVPELIEKARQQGGESYEVCSYEELAAGHFAVPHLFDVVIFNFSLFGEDSVQQVLAAIRDVVHQEGKIFVQTLHPVVACEDAPYEDGWREGSWAGFNQGFTNPAPWYFRTLSSWVALFRESGIEMVELIEPLHPYTKKPASVIFVGVPVDNF